MAEELFLNRLSTGAGNDLSRATELARKMVCDWGMSALGPLTYGSGDGEIFLGKELMRHQNYSEATAVRIDAEVKGIIDSGYGKAREILSTYGETLKTIAATLLEREVLDGEELYALIEASASISLPHRKTPPGPEVTA